MDHESLDKEVIAFRAALESMRATYLDQLGVATIKALAGSTHRHLTMLTGGGPGEDARAMLLRVTFEFTECAVGPEQVADLMVRNGFVPQGIGTYEIKKP